VEWVVVRPVAYPPGDEQFAALERVRTSPEFEVVVDNGDVLILHRVRPPPAPVPTP
jgi:hypothetical protein